jgi:hypothetical protein
MLEIQLDSIISCQCNKYARDSRDESNFYSNLENLVLGARSELNGFAGKDSELFWSSGVLECWSVGKS